MTVPAKETDAKIDARRFVLVLFVVSLLWLAFNAVTLLRYPTVLSDESLVALVAYRMTTNGQLPSVSHYDPFGVYPYRLYLVGLAQWFNWLGVGLIQGRAFSLLGGYIAGWLIFVLGRQLYDTWVGLWASLIFWFMPHMFWTSHFVRPETWVTVANLSLFVAGWWLIQNPGHGRAWLVGFLSVAILDVYLSTISTTITVALLVVLVFGRRRRWALVWLFAGGALLGIVYYLLVQFAPDWHATLANWQSWLAKTGHAGPRLSLLQRGLAAPQILFGGYVSYSKIGWLEAAYLTAAIVLLTRRHHAPDLYVLGSAGVALAVFAVAFGTPWHTLDALPMPVITVAAGLSAGAEYFSARFNPPRLTRLPRFGVDLYAAFCAAPLLAGYLGLSLYYWAANRNYDYFAYVKALQSFTQPQSVILGEGTWWWGFANQPYWWDEELETTDQRTAQEARQLVESIMRDRRITTVLVDENLGLEVQPSANIVTRSALADYLSVHCQLRGIVALIAYGLDFNGPGSKLTQIYECPPYSQ